MARVLATRLGSRGSSGIPTFESVSVLIAFDTTLTSNGTLAKVASPDALYEYFTNPSAGQISAIDGVNVFRPNVVATGLWQAFSTGGGSGGGGDAGASYLTLSTTASLSRERR